MLQQSSEPIPRGTLGRRSSLRAFRDYYYYYYVIIIIITIFVMIIIISSTVISVMCSDIHCTVF
jgi:uncharacterized membrane protein YdfJ with MMPL/SSD domain